MRKLYWGCAAAGLAALGLFQAADYSCRHPESLLTRCVLGAYQASVHVRPLYHLGEYLAERTPGTREDDDEDAIEIPEEPEPVVESEPCPAELESEPAQAQLCPQSSGRLPGKIVINEREELPMATSADPLTPEPKLGRFVQGIEDQLAREPDLERFVQGIEDQWINDVPAVGVAVAQDVFGQSPERERRVWPPVAHAPGSDQEQCPGRQMPYCTDDDDSVRPPMPYSDEAEITPRKPSPPRIWNPFPPKGTEVGGGDEPELNPNGNDCREDPSAMLQVPAGPSSTGCAGKKAPPAAGGEEPSELPPMDKKKSKRAEPPKTKRTFDESKLLPFAAPVKLDTMEFRPSDWGKNDVPLPPF